MVLRWMPAQPHLLNPDPRDANASSCRLGVVVSSKVSKRAVQRNRLRRLLHGHVSGLLRQLPPDRGQWLLISLKPGSETADPAALLGECSSLLAQAGLQP